MKPLQKPLFFRKLLAGSLSFFLLSSNFSFLGVNLESGVSTTYAVTGYPAYDPNIVYSSGGYFNYNGIDIDVTGTGVGNATSTYSPWCDTKDIAIWSGSSVQIWSACNAGATTAYSGSGQSTVIADTSITGGPDAGQQLYMGYYYQWHRNEPITNNSLTGILANVHSGATFAGHPIFITGSSSFGYNWAAFTGTNSNPVWADSPCWTGYIMPMSSDWAVAKNILGTNLNYFENILKLPRAWGRTIDGQYVSGHGKYWAANPSGAAASGLWLDSNGSWSINVNDSRQRAIGSSVRCMLNTSVLWGSGTTTPNECTAWSSVWDHCGGGIVYMNTGGIVSIAAPTDEPGQLAWWSSGVTNATDMDNGFPNTETLSGAIGSAAKSCWDKVGSGSTTDWYLPSKHELLDIHAFSGVIGGFAYSRYWSSTEFDATDSYDVWFGGGSDGQWANTYKGSNDKVRCVRRIDFNASGGGGGGWTSSPQQTTNYVPGTTLQSPIRATFSNSGQVAGTGSIAFSITNDRPQSISGVTVLSIVLSDKFLLNTPVFSAFSGALAGNSCSGAVVIKKDATATSASVNSATNIVECKLTNPLPSFAMGTTMSVVLNGVTNPVNPGRYSLGAKLKTANWDEFFYGETFIRDNSDLTPPVVNSVFSMSPHQLLLEFNEPIYIDYANNSISGSFSPSLDIYNSYTDYNDPRKLFISTSTQTGATAYGFVINGIRDFNGNVATATGNYTSFDPLSKDLDYVSSSTFSQGKNYADISLYGKNNIFSGVEAGQITGMSAWSGITFSSIVVDESNKIHFHVSVSSGAALGSRDLSVTVAGTGYRLFNALWIDKNWDNVAFRYNTLPTDYNASAKTGKLQIEFSDEIVNAGSFTVDKNYGTTSLVPDIIAQAYTGKMLELTLTGVEAGNGYDLTFSGIVFSGGKTLNDYDNKTFFSFFDGNYSTQILPPIVNHSFPGNNASDVPVKSLTETGFVMRVGFDQELDSSTVTSTNIQLKDKSWNEVASTLSYTGTELTVTTSTPLSYGSLYTLNLSASVKSAKWLNLAGNISTADGGGHVITFNTVADYSNISSAASANGFFIEKTDPFSQAQDVPRDAKMRVIFNEVIDKTTVNNDTVKLLSLSGATPVMNPISFTYDNDYTPKTLYISGGVLSQNTKYKLVIAASWSGVKSVKKQTLATPLQVEFKTGTGFAANIPLNIAWDYKSPDNTSFEIGFSSPLDTSTINASSVSLYQSGGTKITSSVNYDHFANSIHIEPSTQLLDNTAYKIVLKAGAIKDIGGNTVQTGALTNGFTYDSPNGTIEKSYSTAGTVVLPFFVESFWATSAKVEVKFSKAIADALNKSNYTIRYCNATSPSICTPDTSVLLTDAVIQYNDVDRKVSIEGLSIPPSTLSTQTTVEIDLSNVRDKFSNSLTEPTQKAVLFNASVGTAFQWTTQAVELKASARPQNNTAGKKTLYFIDFPVSSKLTAGSKIEVSFPNQFDLTSAVFDSGSYANYVNGDKTKPKFTITKLTDKNVLQYVVTSDYAANLQDNDYIVSDVQGIVNPTQTKDYTTDGYIVDITTKNSSGVVLSKIQSNPLYIQEAPAGNVLKTITIQLKDKTGASLTGASISGAVVWLNTPSGYEELLSDNNGTIVYTGELNKHYSLFLKPEIQLKNANTYTASDYVPQNNQFIDIFLDNNKVLDMVLKNKNDASEFVTLSGSITGLSWKEITVWASTPNGFFNKDLGIIGPSASFELRVPKNAGYAMIGVWPTMAPGTAATYKTPDFMPPKPISVNVGTDNVPNLNFAVESATIDFTVIVKDNSPSGKAIPKANVYAYSPSGDSMGLYGQTDAAGQVKFKTKPGVYTYGAYIGGMSDPDQQTITIGSAGTYTGTLIVTLPERLIEGKLLNGNNPVSGVNIYAYNETKGIYLNATTDTSGNYKFYVEDGTWKLGGWMQAYGPLEEKVLTVSGENLTNQNFIVSQSGISTITGTVNLSSAMGTGVSSVNIFAESADNDYTKNFFTFTDDSGQFQLSLKNGNYKVHAYHPQYGEIGVQDVTVSGTDGSIWAFIIAAQKNVTVTMTGAGLPTDLSKFEWIVDVFDVSNKKGFSKKIKSLTGYTFENVASGTYGVKINIVGIGQAFSSGSFVVNTDRSIDIDLPSTEQPVGLSGTVYITGTTTPLQDAFVEMRNTVTKQSIGIKTNSWGVFDMKIKKGTSYELMVKKPGYDKSEILSGTIANSGTNVGSVFLRPLTTTINVSGTVVGSGSLDSKKAFISLQWVNGNGLDTSKWFGQSVTISGSTFVLSGVPENFGTGKLIFATEWYEMKTDTVRNYSSSHVTGLSLALNPLEVSAPKSLPITPSQGGVFSDNEAGMKITLPGNALGTSTDQGKIITKETSVIPNTPGWEPVGWKAKEITAVDANGQPITNLNSDITLELTYSGSELTGSNSGITLEEVKNMQISYYDSTAESWVSLPTVVSSNSGTLFENHSGSVLLSALNPASLVFTLKTETDHFTLFTALVSTVVTNSTVTSSAPVSTPSSPAPSGGSSSGGGGGGSASLTTGLAATFNGVSKYLGDTTQSIVLKSGKNINNVLSIKRDGKTIALTDLLKSGANTMSNVGKNLVSFAVGDVISTSQEGSLEIALDGYSKMQISPWSSMKIAEVGNGFLSYENLGGSVQYQFDKRDGGKFQYKVKGKTGYATIRGTTLEVSSDNTKDVYKLIEGKIDIYNSFLKKTVSLVSGDSYTAYANGKEDTSKIAALKAPVAPSSTKPVTNNTANTVKTTPAPAPVVSAASPCGAYKDVESKSEWCPYITKLNEKKVIRTNASYEPNRSISRAELLKMASLSRWVTPIFNKLYTYSDIKTTDWWAPYVSTAKRLGYISAVNATFEPNRPITRAEAMKIIMNFSGIKIAFDAKYTYSDIKTTDWWAPYVSTAKRLGYISATQTKFRPNDPISRAEVAKILYNIFFK